MNEQDGVTKELETMLNGQAKFDALVNGFFRCSPEVRRGLILFLTGAPLEEQQAAARAYFETEEGKAYLEWSKAQPEKPE